MLAKKPGVVGLAGHSQFSVPAGFSPYNCQEPSPSLMPPRYIVPSAPIAGDPPSNPSSSSYVNGEKVGGNFPFQRAVWVQRVEQASLRSDVNRPVGTNRRRGRHLAAREQRNWKG